MTILTRLMGEIPSIPTPLRIGLETVGFILATWGILFLLFFQVIKEGLRNTAITIRDLSKSFLREVGDYGPFLFEMSTTTVFVSFIMGLWCGWKGTLIVLGLAVGLFALFIACYWLFAWWIMYKVFNVNAKKE